MSRAAEGLREDVTSAGQRTASSSAGIYRSLGRARAWTNAGARPTLRPRKGPQDSSHVRRCTSERQPS